MGIIKACGNIKEDRHAYCLDPRNICLPNIDNSVHVRALGLPLKLGENAFAGGEEPVDLYFGAIWCGELFTDWPEYRYLRFNVPKDEYEASMIRDEYLWRWDLNNCKAPLPRIRGAYNVIGGGVLAKFQGSF